MGRVGSSRWQSWLGAARKRLLRLPRPALFVELLQEEKLQMRRTETNAATSPRSNRLHGCSPPPCPFCLKPCGAQPPSGQNASVWPEVSSKVRPDVATRVRIAGSSPRLHVLCTADTLVFASAFIPAMPWHPPAAFPGTQACAAQSGAHTGATITASVAARARISVLTVLVRGAMARSARIA